VAIDGSAGGTINGTVRGCEVRTQYALGSLVSSGYAMSIQAATVSIDHSYLRAGASGGIGGMWGLFLCSAAVTVTDSTIETNDPGSGHPQFAVDMPAGACGTPGLTPALSITRSKLVAIGGSGAANTGFRLGLPAVTPLFASSALIAVGGNAVVANNASSMPLAMNFLASTINGTTATGGRGINVAQTSQLTLGLIDTIVQGVYAISLSGSSNQLAVNHMGINLLHGSSAVLASTNGAADITAYRSAYGDTSAVDMDPLLSVFDNVHLQGGSPALGLAGASPCSTAKDIDGQTRPQSGACDVGADEQ
jgi:hypothetical protein